MRAVSFLRPCRPSRTPRLHGATVPREGGRSSAIPEDHRRPSAVSWPGDPSAGLYLDLLAGGRFGSLLRDAAARGPRNLGDSSVTGLTI
jgi:hypothetical protein